MQFGCLVNMVSTMPLRITMQIAQDELDVVQTDGSEMEQKRMDTSSEFLNALANGEGMHARPSKEPPTST